MILVNGGIYSLLVGHKSLISPTTSLKKVVVWWRLIIQVIPVDRVDYTALGEIDGFLDYVVELLNTTI